MWHIQKVEIEFNWQVKMMMTCVLIAYLLVLHGIKDELEDIHETLKTQQTVEIVEGDQG